MTTNADLTEATADTFTADELTAAQNALDQHGRETDTDGDYNGRCWCGWKDLEFADQPYQGDSWTVHQAKELLRAGYRLVASVQS